jgi:hypothetical protein
MSNTFDELLLFKAERGAGLFRTAVVDSEILETKPACLRPQIGGNHAAHNEEIKLIERVFLFPDPQVRQVVVFCGIDDRGDTGGICARAGRNLAEQTGMPVCLVDADLDAPSSLFAYFGIDQTLPVNRGIFQSPSIRDLTLRIENRNVFLASLRMILGDVGPPWKFDAWPSRLNELRRAFAYVLITVHWKSANQHRVLLGKSADGVILVLESQLTRRETARAIKQSLAEASVQLLGAVLNNHAHPIPDKLYNML